MERRYRVSEYAARLGVSTATVQRRIDKKLLNGVKDGIWYVLVDDKELVDVRTSVPADVRTSVPAVESLSGSEAVRAAQVEAVRAAQVEADVAEQEARKAEAERRIRDAKAGSLDNRADLLDEREKVISERESVVTERAEKLDERQDKLDLLDADLKRRNDELAKNEMASAKIIDDANAEADARKNDSDVVIAEARRIFTEESNKVREELAKLGADIEASKDKIIKDAEVKAKGIVKEAAGQADKLAQAAKVEGAKLDEKKAELDKEQSRLVAETAVVERCMSRLNRDVTELTLYPPKDWPGRIKTLIDFIKGELK